MANGKARLKSSNITFVTGKVDVVLLIAFILIVAIGLLMVFSAGLYDSTLSGEPGYAPFLKQAFFVLIGSVLCYIISKIEYKLFLNDKSVLVLCGLTMLLLGLVLLFPDFNGAKRWFVIGGITFQPSEFAKLTAIIYTAYMIETEPKVLKDWKKLLIYIIIPAGIVCILTVVEPSLTAGLAIAIAYFSVLFFSGIDFKLLLPYIIIAMGVAVLMVRVLSWRMERIFVFFGFGTQDHQISQSLIAFGSGGLTGQGLGQGKQKLLFLSEVKNDFIFANIGEELGFIGCVFVILLFATLIVRGYYIALSMDNKFDYLYASSTITLLAFQVIVNMGVASGAMPVTGMALPFISAGGTSTIILFMMMGPIFGMSRKLNIKRKRHNK